MSNLSFNQPINIVRDEEGVAELQMHFDVTMNRLDKQHSCAQEGEQYFSTLNAFISLNVFKILICRQCQSQTIHPTPFT